MGVLTWRPHVMAFAVALLSSSILAGCGGGAGTPPGVSPDTQSPSQQPSLGTAAANTLRVSNADRVAALGAKVRLAHYMPVMGNAGGRKTKAIIYPADLQYFHGAVIRNTKVFDAYVDAGPSTFGNPGTFLQNLSNSSMIHISDQYVVSSAANRYPVQAEYIVNYPAFTTLGDNDILVLAHAIASAAGPAAYGHIYHLFLAPGLNYCATGTILPAGLCNASSSSPNPQFCAFHTSVVFSDVGETIFSVEPYVDTFFCGVDNLQPNPSEPTPNGLQNDSTYSMASHEEFEMLTDPDPGTGWINPSPFYPSEIGDLCAYLPENTTLNGHQYRIQTEYTNKRHGCDNSPP